MDHEEFLRLHPWPTPWEGRQAVEFSFEFESQNPVGDLWRALSDTSRFNKRLGVRARDFSEVEGQLKVEDRWFGLKQVWIEEPWQWLENTRLSMVRIFQHGILKVLRAHYEFSARPDPTKSAVFIYFGAVPKNILWRGVCKLLFPGAQSVDA